MYLPEEIGIILKSVIAKSKDIILKKNSNKYMRYTNDGRLNIPDYYPNYRAGVEQKESISYHSEYGKFPDALFIRAAPNQSKEEFEYIKSIYKQQTLPVYLDLMSTIQRPMNDKNWSIEHKDSGEDKLKEYLDNDIKDYGSLENFFKFVVPGIKTMDAEGVIAIKPDDLMLKEDGTMDESSDIEPCPYYYESWQVVAYKCDDYFMIETLDKSEVQYGNQKRNIGMIYEFYDDENIWLIRQTGNFVDFTFEIVLYFNHAWGKVPVSKLMGVPVVKNGKMSWQSPFLFVTDILDNVAINLTMLQVSIRNSAYPYKIMVGDVCDFEDPSGQRCIDGKIWRLADDGSQAGQYTCGACNGRGIKNRMSPGGVMLLKPKTREDDGDSTFSQPPLQYIAPDTAILEFIEAKSEKDTQKARQILHLHTSNSNVKGSEDMTATGMSLDMKALYAFIQPQIQQIFYLWEFTIDAIGWMRYGDGYNKPTFNYPQNYDFVSEEDVLVQISDAMKAGLPPFMMAVYLERYLRSMYFNETQTGMLLDLVLKTDRILGLTNEDIILQQSRGLIQDWEIILHDSGLTFIRDIVRADNKFFEKDFATQQKALVDMAKAKAAEIKASKSLVGSIIGAAASPAA